MAALTTAQITQAGTTLTAAAAAGGGDTVIPGDNTFLYVKNAGVGSIDVTVDDPVTPSPTAATTFNPDAKITVAAGAEKLIGPLRASRFANPSTGLVNVTYSGVTSVTVAALAI